MRQRGGVGGFVNIYDEAPSWQLFREPVSYNKQVCVHIYIYTHTRNTYIHVYTCIYIYVYIYIYMFIFIYNVCVYRCIHMYICMYINVYIYTYMYINMCIFYSMRNRLVVLLKLYLLEALLAIYA